MTATAIATATGLPTPVAPTVSAVAIVNHIGYVGYLAQGKTYQVCANVTPGGSAIASVTADVSAITAGQTAAPLASGSFTCEGVNYNYRSAQLTADSPLSQGIKTFTVSAAGVGSGTTTVTGTVTIDNTKPTLSDFRTFNAVGGTAGKIEPGDWFTVTINEANAVDLNNILPGWDGTAAFPVQVKLINRGQGLNDTLSVCTPANANCTFSPSGSSNILGGINLGGRDYIAGNAGDSAVFDATLAFMSTTGVFTVTMGACPNCDAVTRSERTTARFSPLTGNAPGVIRDRAGNTITGSPERDAVQF